MAQVMKAKREENIPVHGRRLVIRHEMCSIIKCNFVSAILESCFYFVINYNFCLYFAVNWYVDN